MSRLSKLAGKEKEYEIGGEKFTFKPLTVKNMDIFVEMENESKRANAMRKLIHKTLMAAVPEATDEEIEKISAEHFKNLLEAIKDVNGLQDEVKRKGQSTIQSGKGFGQTS